jgi:hypothetical protein
MKPPEPALMACPECERLKGEEAQATIDHTKADEALDAAVTVPSNRQLGPSDIEEWQKVTDEADTARKSLDNARRQRREHQRTCPSFPASVFGYPHL